MNRVVAKKFRDKLEDTVRRYNERRSKLFAQEEFKREQASEEIVKNTTAQALQILNDMDSDRESFRRMGLSVEEKTYYDILTAVCDEYRFLRLALADGRVHRVRQRRKVGANARAFERRGLALYELDLQNVGEYVVGNRERERRQGGRGEGRLFGNFGEV